MAIFLSSGAAVYGGTCGGSHGKNIVETAASAGRFETLVAAVQAAGLVDTLSSPGPFTVFAPTDDAFAKLPGGTLDRLLKNPDQLAAILKLHVVPGKLLAADVVKLSSARTALGQVLHIDTTSGVRIGAANVINTDIETSNGVIHVIDSVLLPENDIVETARSAGNFKTLLAALEAADLTDALRGEGPLTIFAPTDEAFGKLPEGTVESLLRDIPKLRAVLTYHVVPAGVMAKDVVNLSQAKTLQGQSVRISSTSGVMINDARVVKADIETTNGVIHVIDAVLIPN
jgi:uncharacterized surface protein with fasciclin (FAS1) repeats